jgi:hypothetical protein
MRSILDLAKRLSRARCCPPPQPPQGLQAGGGGGSGESQVTWLPGPADIAFYRVYRHKGNDQLIPVAVVLPSAIGILEPGRLGIVDAPDYWPWPSGADSEADRMYRVTATSTKGLDSGLSAPATAFGPFS